MAKLNNYDYNFFYDLYFTQNKSTIEISKLLGVAKSSVARRMGILGFELRKNIKVKCSHCGTEIERHKSEVYGDNKKKNFYCSKDCEYEHKKELFKGDLNPFFGKKHTDKTRKIISKTNKGKKMPIYVKKKISQSLSGSNSPYWKDGSAERNKKDRLRLEYRDWRNKVFERDNYTCQKCYKRCTRLHAHHIKNYSENPKLRFIPVNGITMCEKCHRQFHEIYTRSNNTPSQLIEYLRSCV